LPLPQRQGSFRPGVAITRPPAPRAAAGSPPTASPCPDPHGPSRRAGVLPPLLPTTPPGSGF
jgi:hypothetical protein